ncbi:hypothetical protein GIB67_020604 [Kingdonia uniflora]|uniref:Uncharacterized protein n=1 Tax=Kingdonia uniflora TaxID=39325 RepID=A0A7J7M8W5_9MAGN|nr:hypothetical protein GIB67_020604 [Kingdonia uniflora]
MEGIYPTPGCNKTARGDQYDSCKRLLNPTKFTESKYKGLELLAKPPEIGYGYVIPDSLGAVESHERTKILAEKVGNGYLQEINFGKLYMEDPDSCSIVMRTSVGIVYLLETLLETFMPSFTLKVLKQLNLPISQLLLYDKKRDVDRVRRSWEVVPSGHMIGMPATIYDADR